MKVLHLNQKTFDIFFNQGWENWARFQIDGNKKLQQVAGVEVPKNIKLFLEKRYK